MGCLTLRGFLDCIYILSDYNKYYVIEVMLIKNLNFIYFMKLLSQSLTIFFKAEIVCRSTLMIMKADGVS